MSKIIEVKNISKKYKLGETVSYKVIREEIIKKLNFFRRKKTEEDEFYALRDINFEVNKGDILGIIGRNGAGKTTLLKILTQVTTPTTGIIKMKGRVGSLLEVGTGFNQELTGRENVYLNGAILGMKKREIDKKFDDIVEFAGVEKFIDTPVKRYSSGMTVRLAFAVAAHLEPEILVVDEVLSVGDQYFQQKSLGKMDQVAKEEGRTVLFVSHNLEVVKKICNKVLVLNEGKVVFHGQTRDAVDYYLNMIRNDEIKIEKKKRAGKGGIKFTGVKIVNSKGEESKHLKFGEQVKFIFSYESKVDDMSDVFVGFTLGSEFKEIALNLGSNFVRKSLDLKKKKGEIELTIPKLLIYPGVYQINSTIKRKSIVEDTVKAFADFIVDDSNYFGQNILPPRHHQDIFIDYDWEVKN